MTVLVVAEHDNTQLKNSTLNTITAAKQLSRDIHILVAGYRSFCVAESASKIPSVQKVIWADGISLAKGLAENLAEQILMISSNYDHTLFPETTWGKNIAPRVAAKLDIAPVTNITSIISQDTFQRPIYAGSALITVKSRDTLKVITVSTTSFSTAQSCGNSAPIDSVGVIVDSKLSSLVKREVASKQKTKLADARVVVAGGYGLGSAAGFKILHKLAGKLDAAIGASRSAIDAGYAPNDCQIGQTGKTIAPELYIAVGISGAAQHLSGIRDAKIIVAINKDPGAPILSIANYALIGDWFEIIPALIHAL